MYKPTFAVLRSFLDQLGFEMRIIPGSHILFTNTEVNVRIMLRLYEDGDKVEPAGLAYVRHTRDEWGIMERDQFDEQMLERSMACRIDAEALFRLLIRAFAEMRPRATFAARHPNSRRAEEIKSSPSAISSLHPSPHSA